MVDCSGGNRAKRAPASKVSKLAETAPAYSRHRCCPPTRPVGELGTAGCQGTGVNRYPVSFWINHHTISRAITGTTSLQGCLDFLVPAFPIYSPGQYGLSFCQ